MGEGFESPHPSFDTLAKLSRATGLEFHFEVACGGVELVDE
ncbi:hypothetical protein [Frankia sp. Cr2]|nr:hypothetical protein [Frankia sp. Cr2]